MSSIHIRKVAKGEFQLVVSGNGSSTVLLITHEQLIEVVSALGLVSSFGTLQNKADRYTVYFPDPRDN